MENPCIGHFRLFVTHNVSQRVPIILLEYIDNFLEFSLSSLNLGGSLPELNEYDHVGEGSAKDTGDETSLNCEVTSR